MLAVIWLFGRAADLQIEYNKSNTAISDFEEKKKVAISNNQAQKAMITNLTLKITFAKLGTLFIILTDLYHFYQSINNNKM